MSSSGNRFLNHFMLVLILILIYLAVVSTFLLTYGLTESLGTIPAVPISLIAGFAALALGAKGFWYLADKLSEKNGSDKSLQTDTSSEAAL